MKDKPPYVPQAGSLAGRVCAWFLISANRDEELTFGDIATKFDASRVSVNTLLAPAIANDLLRKIQTGSNPPVVVAGSALEALKQAAQPAEATDAKAKSARAPRTYRRGTLPPLDMQKYPVMTGVPVPQPNGGCKGKSKYTDLFAGLSKAGQSRHGLPNTHRSAISKVCAQASKPGGPQFVCRSESSTTFGVWRLK